MKYPAPIENLIDCFSKLPGVGNKSAERLALSTLNLDQEVVKLFAASLLDTKTKIKRCKKCNNLTDKDECLICKDKNRNKDLLCVVEDAKNIILFEKNGLFNGYYHVINGLISPLDGINPEDINIDELIKRIEKDKVKEVIIAVKPSIEGETTAMYIKKIIEGLKIKVTRLASGIPLGTEIEYIDSMTLERALNDRKEIE